jgi:hypothetical protein
MTFEYTFCLISLLVILPVSYNLIDLEESLVALHLSKYNYLNLGALYKL